MFFDNKFSSHEKSLFFHPTYCFRWSDYNVLVLYTPFVGWLGLQNWFFGCIVYFEDKRIQHHLSFIQDPKKNNPIFKLVCSIPNELS